MATALSSTRSRRIVRTFYVQHCPLKGDCNGKARFLGATPELAIERVHHHLVHSSRHWKTAFEADELTTDLDVECHDDYEDVPPTPPPAPKRARPAIGAPPPASSPVVRTHIQQVIFDAIEAVTDAENAAVQSEYMATSAATAFREQALVYQGHVQKLEECLAEVEEGLTEVFGQRR